jgi:hypothetical protein
MCSVRRHFVSTVHCWDGLSLSGHPHCRLHLLTLTAVVIDATAAMLFACVGGTPRHGFAPFRWVMCVPVVSTGHRPTILRPRLPRGLLFSVTPFLVFRSSFPRSSIAAISPKLSHSTASQSAGLTAMWSFVSAFPLIFVQCLAVLLNLNAASSFFWPQVEMNGC